MEDPRGEEKRKGGGKREEGGDELLTDGGGGRGVSDRCSSVATDSYHLIKQVGHKISHKTGHKDQSLKQLQHKVENTIEFDSKKYIFLYNTY